jgi:hypothetical protein
LNIESGIVSLRAELPTDMDCTGTAEPSTDDARPLIHRIPLDALLDPAGRPAVTPAYSKGC